MLDRLNHITACRSTLSSAVMTSVAIAGILSAPQLVTASADTDGHKTTTSSPAKIALLPSKEEHGDLLTIRGRVVMSDGRPVAGAKVSVVTFLGPADSAGKAATKPDIRHLSQFAARRAPPKRVTLAVTQSSVTGTFQLTYRKSQFDPADRWQYAPIVAEKQGLGANEWVTWWRIDASKPFVLTLVPDLPIRGRIVDLEGKPIPGVRVDAGGSTRRAAGGVSSPGCGCSRRDGG